MLDWETIGVNFGPEKQTVSLSLAIFSFRSSLWVQITLFCAQGILHNDVLPTVETHTVMTGSLSYACLLALAIQREWVSQRS